MSKQNVGNLKQEKQGERTKPDEREKKKGGGNQKRRKKQLAIISQHLRKEMKFMRSIVFVFCLFLILPRQSWKIVANCKMEKTNFQFGFEAKLIWGVFTQKRW